MCEVFRELMKEEIEEELKKSHDQGIGQGIQQGIEQGRLAQLIDSLNARLLPLETAAQCAKMTPAEFQATMNTKAN